MSILLALLLLQASGPAPRVVAKQGITLTIPEGWHVLGADEEIERSQPIPRGRDKAPPSRSTTEPAPMLIEILKYKEPIPTLNVSIQIEVGPSPEGVPRDAVEIAGRLCLYRVATSESTEQVGPIEVSDVSGYRAAMCRLRSIVVGGGRPAEADTWNYVLLRGEELIAIAFASPPNETKGFEPVMKAFLDNLVIVEPSET